jgi:ABC-type dipeptide/oligopeptide/nickel transport system ATPase subunit
MGKSGCGKSSLARIILGLQEYDSGRISLAGPAQIVLQDPCESLNPRHQVKTILEEALIIQGLRKFSSDLMAKILKDVNLPLSSSFLSRYPHQLSGGERSRIVLARALSMRPKLLICDESLSMLDFYTQKQIIKLLQKLQSEYQISYLFISHDLNLVKQLTDKIYILDQGKISNYR